MKRRTPEVVPGQGSLLNDDLSPNIDNPENDEVRADGSVIVANIKALLLDADKAFRQALHTRPNTKKREALQNQGMEYRKAAEDEIVKHLFSDEDRLLKGIEFDDCLNSIRGGLRDAALKESQEPKKKMLEGRIPVAAALYLGRQEGEELLDVKKLAANDN